MIFLEKLTFGYALTGSFCTFEKSLEQMKRIKKEGIDIVPIMSQNAYTQDTRFGTAEFFRREIEEICERKIISEITEAEPIGPKKMLDLLIVSPCSGNTLGKIAAGIYDTAVTMAVKSHLRNWRPVLIGVSTNDALRASAKSIGTLMNFKNFYFIPMKQDNPEKKPFSVVCDFGKTLEAAMKALEGEQAEPILI